MVHFRAPLMVSAPLGTLSVKSCPLPAEEAASATVPAALSVIMTVPVEFAASVVAVVSLTVMPPVPLRSVSDGVSNKAVLMAPPAPGVAVRERDLDAAREPVSVMSPLVEVRLTTGADRFVSPASVSVSNEDTVTDPVALVPVMVPPRVTPLLVDVRLTASAEILPLVERLFFAVRSIAPMLPVLANISPVASRAAFDAVTVNDEPAPAEDLPRVTVPAAVSVTETLPVEFAETALALVLVTLMPPVPLTSVRD